MSPAILLPKFDLFIFRFFLGVDDCHDVDRDMLVGIYERVKANEFKPGSDHVTQVLKVQSTIVGKKPVSTFSVVFILCWTSDALLSYFLKICI